MRYSTLVVEKYFDDRKSDIDIFAETQLCNQNLTEQAIAAINQRREELFQIVDQVRQVNLGLIKTEEPDEPIQNLIVFGCGLKKDGTLCILPGVFPDRIDIHLFVSQELTSSPPKLQKFCFAAPVFLQVVQVAANFFSLLENKKHEVACFKCKTKFNSCPFYCTCALFKKLFLP